jgi:hypothetical protein
MQPLYVAYMKQDTYVAHVAQPTAYVGGVRTIWQRHRKKNKEEAYKLGGSKSHQKECYNLAVKLNISLHKGKVGMSKVQKKCKGWKHEANNSRGQTVVSPI